MYSHLYTAPYSPHDNPTERASRTVKSMIAQFIEGEQESWDNPLPEITLAVNSSISDTTNFSPIFLMQGRDPRMPKALYEEKTRGNGNTPEDFTIKAAKIKEIFEFVKINAERANADLRRREWRPALGSLVLVKQHQLSRGVDGFAAKLATKYDGPFRVLKFIRRSYRPQLGGHGRQ